MGVPRGGSSPRFRSLCHVVIYHFPHTILSLVSGPHFATRLYQIYAEMASSPYIQYSVVVPAFRENGNIRPLVTRIFAALKRIDSPVPAEQTEVIIVDDNSRDGSVETVQALQQEGYNVRIIVRTTERGLSSAVVRGFQEAAGDSMLCMDADLQVRD